jgi:hypothetical protein
VPATTNSLALCVVVPFATRVLRPCSDDNRRPAFALMALCALLSDAAAASQLIGGPKVAAGLFRVVAGRMRSKPCSWVSVARWQV